MNRGRQKGFTLVELAMVVILIGVLAVYALPRLDIGLFSERGYYEQALVALRFAQKQAVASNCATRARFNSVNSCEVIRISGCNGLASDTNLSNPATGDNNFCNHGEASSLGGTTSFVFDSLGRSSGTLLVNGQQITVHANTGFIQEP